MHNTKVFVTEGSEAMIRRVVLWQILQRVKILQNLYVWVEII